ncbi:MAG: hypothetical protein HYS59_01935 [Candidatus Vogelbacteria bacterium]|nr:hypothetical protein [Candidatus Vogelbacteria bacterium]
MRYGARTICAMLVLGAHLVSVSVARAQGTGVFQPSSGGTRGGLTNPLGEVSTLNQLIAKILDALVQLAIPVAILFIVYAGFLFVTARGDEKQLETAKATLLWTVIGIGILVGADIIAGVVQSTIGLLN